MSKLGLAVVAGYIIGSPVLSWFLRDLKSFHRPLWVGYGSRDAWRNGAVMLYLLGGWPVLLLAVAWRTGESRAALSAARERFQPRRDGRR